MTDSLNLSISMLSTSRFQEPLTPLTTAASATPASTTSDPVFTFTNCTPSAIHPDAPFSKYNPSPLSSPYIMSSAQFLAKAPSLSTPPPLESLYGKIARGQN